MSQNFNSGKDLKRPENYREKDFWEVHIFQAGDKGKGSEPNN